jgi:glycine/serine hydroxymethyltransferase
MDDPLSLDILEALRPKATLNLFPTENRMSPRALQALSSDAVHRYPMSEGPGFFYGNTPALTQVYEECGRLARGFFGARHAFVNFLSGLHTMQSLLSALTAPGDHLLIMDPTCGGHYATSAICERLGLSVDFLPFDRDTCLIDCRLLRRRVEDSAPRLIYLDVSTALRMPRMKELRAAVGPAPYICFDASHLLGLLPAAPEGTGLEAGATTCSGSTHKSFPGPQKGILLTNDEAVATLVGERLGYAVSSAHANSVGALAITFEELMAQRVDYGHQIMANARRLAASLDARGFRVAGREFGYTETHQIWVEPHDGVSPIDWGRRLLSAGVRVTVVTLPTTGHPGLRLGVQELTRVGMGADEMELVADLFARCLLTKEPPDVLERKVAELAQSFRTVHYVRQGDGTAATEMPAQV